MRDQWLEDVYASFDAGVERYIDRIVNTPPGLRFEETTGIFDSEPFPNSMIHPS